MFRASFFLLILCMILSCKKEETNNKYFTILGYGLPNMLNIEGRNGIAEKWKIKYVDVAGCEVDQKLMDSVNTENKKTFAKLENRYGKDWKVRYDKNVEDFMINKVDVMGILITNKLFRSKLRDYNIEIDNVDKEVKELNDQGLYEVVVVNNNLKYENKECFRVKVDIKKRTVNLIN